MGCHKRELKNCENTRRIKVESPVIVPSNNTPNKTKRQIARKTVPYRQLLKFQGKYPEIFYDKLEKEINFAYSNPELPNASLMLCRKLIENLLYNLLQKRFLKVDVGIYFDKSRIRARDFSVSLDVLKTRKSEFSPDLHASIEKFLSLVGSFRVDANAKTHYVIEYLDKTSEINQYKIPEMTQLLLSLIERVA